VTQNVADAQVVARADPGAPVLRASPRDVSANAGPDRKARRLVFMVVHFDDWVGDYQPQYFADMDEHLLQNPIVGAELVFCPASNLFERTFTMRSALVLPE
jgi:hypothetical protein